MKIVRCLVMACVAMCCVAPLAVAQNSNKNMRSAGSKAKTDMEQIWAEKGFVNIGLPQTRSDNKVYSFFRTLASVCVMCFRIRRGHSAPSVAYRRLPKKLRHKFQNVPTFANPKRCRSFD